MTQSIFTRDQAKARARAIRAEFSANNRMISHSAALERVAAEQGFSDWNTMSARLSNAPDSPLQVGDRIEGIYLKQSFDGVIIAVRSMADGAAFEVSIELDEAVDVVEFDSFSNFRQRIQATISPGGTSYAKTSDGVPHLVVVQAPSGHQSRP